LICTKYEFNTYYYYVASNLEHILPYVLCRVYLKWHQICYRGCSKWFQTAPIFCLSPKVSNDASYLGVPHHDPILPIGFWNNMGYLHQLPKHNVPNRKTTRFHRLSYITAGSAASIRPLGPHPPWMRTDWCCGPHRGPRDLQSWQAWAPDLDIEIHPPR